MPVVDIFSKRQKRLRGDIPDVYQYTLIPQALRVQIVYIMEDAFEIIKNDGRVNNVYEQVYKTFCREHGRRQSDASSNPYTNLLIPIQSWPLKRIGIRGQSRTLFPRLRRTMYLMSSNSSFSR